jgi:hypothetical protein
VAVEFHSDLGKGNKDRVSTENIVRNGTRQLRANGDRGGLAVCRCEPLHYGREIKKGLDGSQPLKSFGMVFMGCRDRTKVSWRDVEVVIEIEKEWPDHLCSLSFCCSRESPLHIRDRVKPQNLQCSLLPFSPRRCVGISSAQVPPGWRLQIVCSCPSGHFVLGNAL